MSRSLLLVAALCLGAAHASDHSVVEPAPTFNKNANNREIRYPSCTGAKPVCRDWEDPAEGHCQANVLKRKTVRFDAQNWPGPLFNGWVYQIIMGEQLQIPVEWNDEDDHEGGVVDFYNYDVAGGTQGSYGWGGNAYPFDALDAANKDPTCRGARDAENPGCAHAMLEIWSGKLSQTAKFVKEDKLGVSIGPSGVNGRLGWYTQGMVADAFGGFTHREINTPGTAEHFGRPMRWDEHCAVRAYYYFNNEAKAEAEKAPSNLKEAGADRHGKSYATSLCHFVFKSMTHPTKLASTEPALQLRTAFTGTKPDKDSAQDCVLSQLTGKIFKDGGLAGCDTITLDEVLLQAKNADVADHELPAGFENYFKLSYYNPDPKLDPQSAYESNMTRTAIYEGDLLPYAEGKGTAHVAEAPCSWTTYSPVQSLGVNVDPIPYNWGELVQTLNMGVYNMLRVRKDEDDKRRKDDPYFVPVLFWWWNPETLFEKWKYKGDHTEADGTLPKLQSDAWKMESVLLESWTDDCEKARQANFVTKFKDGGSHEGCVDQGTVGAGQDPRGGAAKSFAMTTFNDEFCPFVNGNDGVRTCASQSCDFPLDALQVVASSSLDAHSPDAATFMRKMRFSQTAQNHFLATYDLNQEGYSEERSKTNKAVKLNSNKMRPGKAGDMDADLEVHASTMTREQACAWVNDNKDDWNYYMPDQGDTSALQLSGCRSTAADATCSGKGTCVGNGIAPGQCKCNAGYAGHLCENIDHAKLPAAIWDVDPETKRFVWDMSWDVNDMAGGYTFSVSSQQSKSMVVHVAADGPRSAMIAMAALGMLVSIAFLVFAVVKADKPILKYAQPLFIRIMLVASLISYASVLFNNNAIIDSNMCTLATWCGHMGFSLCFAALFAKTWRLHKIFNNKKLKKKKITNNELVGVVVGITGVTFLILLIWTIVGAADPSFMLQPIGEVTENAGEFQVWVQCGSEQGGFFAFLLLGWEAILLLYGAMLAFLTRNVDPNFSEAKYIAITIYNMFVIGLLVVGLHYALSTTIDPDGQYILMSAGQVCATLFAMCLIFIPKFMNLDAKSAATTSGTSGTAGTSAGADHSAALQSEVTAAKQKNNDLAKEVEELKSKLKDATSQVVAKWDKEENQV